MPRRKRKTEMENATEIVMGFATLVDTIFVRYTGKTVQTLLKESAQRPRALPSGEKAILPAVTDILLADAYAIFGLKPDATLEDVKKQYHSLARAFHSDRGIALNDEAMKLLNKAYECIMHQRGK